MLIELFGKNFGCFRDEFRLSLLATDIDPNSERGVVEVQIKGDEEPLRLLRALALYGPNASGKSTLLRAAGAISHLLAVTPRLSSDSPLQPYEPFALGAQESRPVELGARAVINGRVYEYQIIFDRKEFIAERLDEWLPDGNACTLIDRRGQGVEGKWQTDPQFVLFATKFRSNSLLLALADSLAPTLAKGIAVGFRNLLRYSDPFANPLRFISGVPGAAQRAREDPLFNDWLLAHLKTADIGVNNVEHRDIDPNSHQDFFEFLVSQMETAEVDSSGQGDRKKKRPSSRLRLLHNSEGGPVPLPYATESLGTKRMIEWSPLIFDLTHAEQPHAIFVDEFDASLHPLLIQAIVRNFNCDIPSSAARGQLVFATHETTLLDSEAKHAVLRRDQIYLTQKSENGASKLYSVAAFRERNNLNIRRRYLQGRYGALPALNSFGE